MIGQNRHDMKTIKALHFVMAVSLVSSLPLMALAQITSPPGSPLPTGIGDIDTLRKSLLTIANWVFAFLLVIAVIYMLVGAFGYLASGGDAEKQGIARNRIVYGLVGVAVGTLAIALVNIVTRYFGGGGISQ